MKTFIKITLMVFLLGLEVNCFADGKKFWKEKTERYEQTKKETIQKGESWNPNKFSSLEEERREKTNEEGWGPVIFIVLGLFVLVGMVVYLSFFLSKATKTENSDMAGCWGIVAMAIIVAIVAIFINFKGCSSTSTTEDSYQEEYWDNARMHSDGHP